MELYFTTGNVLVVCIVFILIIIPSLFLLVKIDVQGEKQYATVRQLIQTTYGDNYHFDEPQSYSWGYNVRIYNEDRCLILKLNNKKEIEEEYVLVGKEKNESNF